MAQQFKYRNKKMFCEDVSIADIVEKVGSPVYIYSKRALLDAYYEFDSAFSKIDHLVCYSMKANSNINFCRILQKAGSGIDCNSGGEFYRALKAGFSPSKIIFTGVGKTEEEIRYVLQYDIVMLKAESMGELHTINTIAGELGKKAPIGIRINPDVNPHTHPYIATGLSENKFGIDSSKAVEAFTLAASLPNLRVVGIDMHIGSQIGGVGPLAEACTKMAALAATLKKAGLHLSHFDIGGGLAISYNTEKSASPKDLAKKIIPILKSVGCKILFEPGRYIAGNAGILVTKVLYTKKNKKKNFVIVDAGMNDLIRPSLYSAHHEIKPVTLNKKKTVTADIVGPVCESGDFFARNRKIATSEHGDLLSIMSAGAYSFVMSSNYNQRRRPPEIIVDGEKFYTARERETYEDLMSKEHFIDALIHTVE